MKLRATVREGTGKTRHYLGVEDADGTIFPAYVEIEAMDGAFYLNYFDASGQCMTDTWHQTLDEAKGQAEYEFRIASDEWTEIE